MSDKPSNFILRVATVAALIISLIFTVRSAWHIGLHAGYAFWGKPAVAVVEEISRYYTTVRKPRPTSYALRLRGHYGFDLKMDSGKFVHIKGRFDTSGFIGFPKAEILLDERLSVKYLSFYPFWSRPVSDLGLVKLFIAIIIFIVSSFFSAVFLLLAKKSTLFTPSEAAMN